MRLLPCAVLVAALSVGFAEAKSRRAYDVLYRRNRNPSPTKEGDCEPGNFYWPARSCCLPEGGPGHSTTPPANLDCPSSWYFNTQQGCCVPNRPSPPTPTCKSGLVWSEGLQCCTPHEQSTVPAPGPSGWPTPPPTPTPSESGCEDCNEKNTVDDYGSHHKVKRNAMEQWDASTCPRPLLTCPIVIYGTFNDDYECVDAMADLNSCGGCASLGDGMDCGDIPNSDLTSCVGGRCVVETCKRGFESSDDMMACVPL